MKYLLIPFLVIFAFFAKAQVYQINTVNGQTISTCTGSFYDSGGAAGDYQSGENYSVTFCSNMPGSQIILTFNAFNAESATFDHLNIYDGPNTGSTLIGAYGSTSLNGSVISSSAGCLTCTWVTDGSVVYAGWDATISCSFPLQAFDANIVSTSVPYFNGDTIHVCQGQPITFTAAGDYYNNDINYHQSDATTVFTWNFGDGSAEVNGTSVTHTFPDGGGYFVVLEAEDQNNANNANSEINMVMVSTTPTFVGTTVTPDTICLGQQVNMSGFVQTVPWEQTVPPPWAGLTHFDDSHYQLIQSAPINYGIFTPGATLTDVNDILSVCVEMEHSYLGDLTVYLTCPNGQSLDFIVYPNGCGGTYLGVPIDVGGDTDPPGTGYMYCWTPSATNGTWATNCTTGGTLAAGDYEAAEPWTELLGCPLNGDWSINITDNLYSDDGFIFQWTINFDPSIIPTNLWEFQNTYHTNDMQWTGDNITVDNNNIATAIPTVSGNSTYTFTAIDDFGCPYDTSITIFVEPAGSPNCCVAPVSNAGPDASTCLLTFSLQAVPNVGTGSWSQTSGPGTSSFSNVNSATSSVTVTTSGTYTFQWFENNGAGCTNFDQVDINFIQQPIANAGPDGQTCSLSFTMAAAPTVGTGSWSQVSGPGTSTFTTSSSATTNVTVSVQGNYVFSWTESNSNCVSSDNVAISFAVQPVASAGADNSVCLLTYQLQGMPSVGTGTWTSTGPGTATFVNNHLATTSVTVSTGGAYTFTWTEDNGLGCVSIDNVIITFTQQPVANAGPNISVCQLNTTMQGIASVGAGTWTMVSGPGTITFTDPTLATTTITGSVQGTYNLLWTENNGNGCTSSDNVTVTLTVQPDAVAGIDNAICSNTYTLAATPSVGTGTWTELSGPGVPAFVNAQSPNTSVSVSLYGPYSFLWTEDNGNGCVSSDTVVITFNYIPTSTFDLSVINCFGDNATVTYTGDGLASATYTWNFGTATVVSGAGQGPYAINYATDGTFPISLQVTQNGCISNTTSQNIINPPLLTLSLSKVDATCFGSNNGSVTSTVGGGTLPYSYLWTGGSVFSSVPSAAAGTYYLTVTDLNGCQKIESITVYEPPKLAIDVPSYMAICNDSAVTILASATGGTYPYSLLWNTGYSTPSITVSPDTSTHYTVMATDANGCTSVSDILVYVYPQLIFSASSSADSICLGEEIIITSLVSGGNNGPYTFYLDGNQITIPHYMYPNMSHTYQLTVMDGCQYSAQVNVPVHLYPSPSIHPSSDITSGCIPLVVQFNESSPESGQTYLWEFGDNESAYVKNPKHVFSNPGTFDVSLTITNTYGCKVNHYYAGWITAYPLPSAQFISDPAKVSIIKPIVSFVNYSTLSSNVMWYFGDGDSSSAMNPVHQYPSYPAGFYDITLVAFTEFGCSDTIHGKIEVKDEFTFYAPTGFSPDNDGINEVFMVSGSGIKEETFQMAIYDRWGEVIFETTDMYQGWDGRVKGGGKATVGSYTWVAKFRDFKKILHERTGILTIVR